MSRSRWADADIIVVELMALGFGLVLAGLLGILGRWGAVGALLGGALILVRAIRAGRRRPWWRTSDSPGRWNRGEDDG